MSDEHSTQDRARAELADELRSIRATGEDEWAADTGATADSAAATPTASTSAEADADAQDA